MQGIPETEEITTSIDLNIDAYIPETRVIIEQKSLGIALDKKRLAACRNRTHAL